jgi:hypothetical protein
MFVNQYRQFSRRAIVTAASCARPPRWCRSLHLRQHRLPRVFPFRQATPGYQPTRPALDRGSRHRIRGAQVAHERTSSTNRLSTAGFSFKVMALACLTAGLLATLRAATQQWMDYFQNTRQRQDRGHQRQDRNHHPQTCGFHHTPSLIALIMVGRTRLVLLPVVKTPSLHRPALKSPGRPTRVIRDRPRTLRSPTLRPRRSRTWKASRFLR